MNDCVLGLNIQLKITSREKQMPSFSLEVQKGKILKELLVRSKM